MKVELKKMALRNFKGFEEAEFEFAHNAVVRGTNGAGKTTIADAYFFAMYGTDSKGRADVNFKHRKEDAGRYKVAHNLEYGVEVTLLKDGVEKKFKRVIKETWSKGDNPVLTGNKTYYYIDGVACSTMRQYNEEVEQIASRELLPVLTNVWHFAAMKPNEKKAVLLQLAYGTSDAKAADEKITANVLVGHNEFADLVAELNGTAVEQQEKVVRAKMVAVKKQIDTLPIEINAIREAMPQEEDFEQLEELVQVQREEVAKIDKQIADKNERLIGVNERKNEVRMKVSNLQVELVRRENEVRSNVRNKKSKLLLEAGEHVNGITALYQKRAAIDKKFEAEKKRTEALEKEIIQLREQITSLRSGNVVLTESEKFCPTCGAAFDEANIIAQKIEAVKKIGIAKRGEYDALVQSLSLYSDQDVSDGEEISRHYDALRIIFREYDKVQEIVKNSECSLKGVAEMSQSISRALEALFNESEEIAGDAECKRINKELTEAKNEAQKETQLNIEDGTIIELQRIKKEALIKIDEWNKRLGSRDVKERMLAQIAEKEKQQAELNNEWGVLENKLRELVQFIKAKDEELKQSVNNLFEIVSFDFVSEQLNGNDRVTCNMYVDGMPYEEANNAKQINAGLDVVNALVKAHGISMPIFIDNAESAVSLIQTISQKIELVVDANYQQVTISEK